MNFCILTVIKNEHQYLDEWIKYHLDLGIDHIFIFEDIDSESHKEITDKYGEMVSLQSIDNILNDDEKLKAREFKLTKKSNPQYIYIRKGLLYLKKLNEYNWCFVIDNDEFITLENQNDDLKNIVSLFSDYDAFIMQWICYGANGLVDKPDYINKGIVETYTKEIQGYIPTATPQSLSKTCYNLNTYQDSYFLYTHQPSKECNFCRTNFKRDRNTPIYDKIYIRHYITKSWEEYVWKRKTRGFLYGQIRDFDFFFKVNPDMNHLKDQLMSLLKKEALVVLPYKQSGSQGNEIRLALNGWRKYCEFDYHFVVIGGFDESLKNEFPWVEFISCKAKEKKEGQYNPHLDVQQCMEVIYDIYHKAYDGFIWMVDDNYAIKSFSLEDITTIHYLNLSFNGEKNQPASYWNHDKWKTRQLLDREGFPHINYTTHYPCYFEFNKLKLIWDKFNMREESYVLEDIYFNYFSHLNPIQVDSIRLGIWSSRDFENKFQNAVNDPNIKFICNSVEGWSKELEQAVAKIVDSQSITVVEQKKPKKILVTGSKGFIGTHLCKYLEERGYSVVGLDRLDHKDVMCISASNLQDVDYVVHLAAQTSVQNTNLRLIERDNIGAFVHIFELCRYLNKRFIFASSSCAYNVTSMYGISKQFDEQFAKLYSWPGCVGLRFHNVYGKDSRKNTLPEICLNSDQVVLYNSGQNYRHFTYIDDVCYSIERAFELPAGLYNVYNPEKSSTLDFANEVKRHKSLAISLISEKIERDKEEQEVEESVPNLIADHYHTLSQGISKIFL